MPNGRDSDRFEKSREASRAATARRFAAAAALTRASTELVHLRRAQGDGHPLVVSARALHAEAVSTLETARLHERAARTELSSLVEALASEPARAIGQLSADYPVVLLPVRLETRFERTPTVLKVRIYPDFIATDSHEPLLSDYEVGAGERFWRAVWASTDERSAWGALVAQVGAPRAAWIARQMVPANLPHRPQGEPLFDAPPTRTSGWQRPPEVRALPEQWIVLCYRGGTEVRRAYSGAVAHRLEIGPGALGEEEALDDLLDLSGDGLRVDPEAAWTFDFDRAEQVGMALRIELTPEEFKLGFERLLVLGVKASLGPAAAATELEQLLESHHYTNGFELVRQGTPTNNTAGAKAGYPPEDDRGQWSFPIERGAPLNQRGADGVCFAQVLGVSADVVAHVGGADRREQEAAAAMANALWPVTWGYFLEQMMAPVFSTDAVKEVRQHFAFWVRGRGPSPAFRVGPVPYGVWPVSSLARWRAPASAARIDERLPDVLRTLQEMWTSGVSAVPRIGRTSDPDDDLLTTLGMDASTREVRVRSMLGEDTQASLARFYGLDPDDRYSQQLGVELMALIGGLVWPRILSVTFHPQAPELAASLVTDTPPSDAQRLDPNYIDFIRWARPSELRSRTHVDPAATTRGPLLYRLLRHACLLEYIATANELLLARGLISEEELREWEVVKMTPASRRRRTPWERLGMHIDDLTGKESLEKFLSPNRGGRVARTEIPRLRTYRAALDTLAGLSTAELERLMTETLDLCSHRLDAWITSLATKRLGDMRTRQPLGGHLGAYGWVEELHPADDSESDTVMLADGRAARRHARGGGYIYAPSMTHAAAAAVLRNAHRTRGGADSDVYTIDLSSARVRDAMRLIDATRQGQPLGAVLGYRFERGLHEGHRALELDKFIEPFRRVYPLPGSAAETSEPVEAIGARNVVDGLALRTAWRAAQIPWGRGGLTPTPAEREAIDAELRRLDEAVDAAADLLMAESVYQLVSGRTDAGAASLDAMAKGVPPPIPEVAGLPRGGTPVIHRVLNVLGSQTPAHGFWGDTPRTPRGRIEPLLNAWVGSLFGDPSEVRCQVEFPDPTRPGSTLQPWITLADLQLEPLDVIDLATAGDTIRGAGALDQHVAYAVRNLAAETEAITIRYAWDGFDPSSERSLAEVVEMARAIHAVFGLSRALRSEDLLPPEEQAAVTADHRMGDELRSRATAAVAEAQHIIDALDTALREINAAPPPATSGLDALRDALRAAALIGIRGAFPVSHAGASVAARELLVEQARRVVSQLRERVAAAAAAADPVASIGAVFGPAFLVLPRFVVPNPDEIAQAIGGPDFGGDSDAPLRWLHQAMRVRAPLGAWRRLMLYVAATHGGRRPPQILQLPHRPDVRWVALPFGNDDEPPPARTVSLTLEGAGVPSSDEPWAGLLIDEWTELIPHRSEEAGLVFEHDGPGAEAPQAVLVAVPPTDAPQWDLETLVDVLNETLDLAQIRAVDRDQLAQLGQVLPAVYLAANAADDTVSTFFEDVFGGAPTTPT